MKILIAEPAAPRGMFEVCLEIAERHLVEGDEVFILDGLKVPFMRGSFGEKPSLHRLAMDAYRRIKGFSMLTNPGIKQVRASVPVNMFSSYEDMATHCDMATLISAINNTLVSQGKSVSEFTRQFDRVGLLFSDALKIFSSVRAIVLANNIDRVYVHNGRASAYYAVVAAAKSLGVNFLIFEWANNKDRFLLLNDHLVQERNFSQIRLADVCSRATDDEIMQIGTEYFNKKARLINTVPGTYLDGDTVCAAPTEYLSATKRVVFFTSSEFEYSGEKDGPFAVQLESARTIAKALEVRGIPLFVRVHPHMRGSYDNHLWQALGAENNIFLFASESSINSYELIKDADCVVTCGSSIGVEAAFAGKKVIALGPVLEEHLGCCLHPQSMREAIDMIDNDALPPPINARYGACKYAYYFMRYGEPYRYASSTRRGHTMFKGRNLPYWRVPRCLEPLRPLRDGIQRIIKRAKKSIHLYGNKSPGFGGRW